MSKIIRTPTQAKGGITPQEKAALDEHAKKWIVNAMSTEPVDPEKIVPAIKGLYAAAGLAEPRVVIAPSPLVMAFAYGAASTILAGRGRNNAAQATRAATYTATGAATYAATDATTHAATHAATCAATCAATDAVTRAATVVATDAATYAATSVATDEATRAATFAATFAATSVATVAATFEARSSDGAAAACFALAGEEGVAAASEWRRAYQGGNMWSAWACYLSAFRDVLGLRLPEYEKFRWWEQAALHGGFRVLHPQFCIVSDRPEVLKVDDQNRPHCENGPSHRWRDGWSLYHWHGVRIPAEWIEDRASLTPQTALTWPNVEQRRAACEILGWANILAALDARVIDTDEDEEIGQLVEVEIPEIGRERFLRVRCGTGRQFALPVPPDMQTALQAQSWTWGIDNPNEFIKPEVRT